MALTIEQISKSLLTKLGRLPEGQSATGAQVAQVQEEYNDLYTELNEDGLVNWTSDADIPTGAAGFIKTLLLSRLADNFGVPNQWLALEDRTKIRLGAVVRGAYIPRPTKSEGF